MYPGELPRTGRWQRGRKYIQRVDEIVEVPGGRPRFYDPATKDELPDRLIEVANGFTSPEEFAQEWGRLGRIDTTVPLGGEEVEERDIVPEAYMREVVLTKEERKCYPQVFPWEGAEEVRWILAHARTVKVVHGLIALWKRKDERRLRATLQAFPQQTPYAFLDRLAGGGEFDWVPEWAQRDLRTAAHAAIMALVNPNLRGVQYELRRDESGGLRYMLTYHTLAQVIYWHLACSIENKTLLAKICKRCGKPFFHTDPRQLYCPRPPGKTRSECGRIAMKEEFKNRWPDGKSHRPRREKRNRIK